MQLKQYQYSDHLIAAFNDAEQNKLEHLYDNDSKRKPKEYQSTKESMDKLKENIDLEKKTIHLAEASHRKLNIGDAASIIIKTIAMTVIPGEGDDAANLAVYDYDRKIYTMSYMHLNKYLVAILGSTSRSQIDSLVQTIVSREDELSFYNPLPKYKIAVGNGIFNCLNKELEPFTPIYTVVNRIQTNYIENAERPIFSDHFTLEGMIGDFANQNPDRIQLLTQIVKSILTGINTSDVFFIVIGPGGDGKSTMFTMITNLIGSQNASYLNFNEITQPDKLLTTLNKKIMLGMDNDVNLYIKKTALLKSMASHETITLQRKYMNSISVEFTPVIVQLCNEMPRFSETKESMRRRIVTFKSENSHYKNGTQNPNVKKYIKNQQFLEYALWYFLNEDITPYYNDYNEVDRDKTDETLNNEDIIGQFINEMESINYISMINKMIPLKHLYSLYLDWFTDNNPGMKPMSLRTFKLKVTDQMYKLGYSYDPQLKHHRVNALEEQDLYHTTMLESYKEGYEMQKAMDSNNQVKCFELTHDPFQVDDNSMIRSSHPVNVITYFDLQDDLFQFARQHDLLDEISEFNIEESHNESQQSNQSVEIQTINEESTKNKIIKAIYEGKEEYFDEMYEKVNNKEYDEEHIKLIIDLASQRAIQNGDLFVSSKLSSLEDEKDEDDYYEKLLSLLNDLKQNYL